MSVQSLLKMACLSATVRGWFPLVLFFSANWLIGSSLGKNVCEKFCSCQTNQVPYFVDCSALDLAHIPHNMNVNNENLTAKMVNMDFSGNQISNIEPFTQDLPIHLLNLRQNCIITIANGTFQKLDYLSYLDLSHNELRGDDLTPEVFKGKYSQDSYEPMPLIQLDLSFNRISTLERSTFMHMTHLEVLILDGNYLRTIDSQTTHALTSLSSLVELRLGDALLKTLPDNLLMGFTLSKLSLAGNQMETVPKAVKSCVDLRKLNMSGNPFKLITREMFTGLNKLDTLDVSYMDDLTEVRAKSFSSLTSLTTLKMHHNPKLEFIHPDAFEDIKSEEFPLTHLFLSHNHLRYLPHALLPSFSNWRELEALDIQANPWECDCHNEWMFTALLDNIEHNTPEMSRNIKCQGPTAELKGKAMTEVSFHPEEVPCRPMDGFNLFQTNYGMKPDLPNDNRQSGRRHFVDKTESHGHNMATALAVICMLIVVCTTLFLGGRYLRKYNLLRYQSLQNDVSFQQSPSSINVQVIG